jgi:hypothetical protein
MTSVDQIKFPTFAELKETNPNAFDKINQCAGLTCYKSSKGANATVYDFDCTINAWRFNQFLTGAQWKTLAILCINFEADISEVIRSMVFETDFMCVRDFEGADGLSQYNYPTNLKGFVDGVFFLIEPTGRAHS